MATETAVAERAPARTKAKKAPRPQGATPWWMWIAVVAIVIFCLFPFYWLVNMSLKTGDDLGESSLFPPNPTLANRERTRCALGRLGLCSSGFCERGSFVAREPIGRRLLEQCIDPRLPIEGEKLAGLIAGHGHRCSLPSGQVRNRTPATMPAVPRE